MILSLVDEAAAAGARHAKAAAVIGISSRTLIRWRQQGGGQDQRQGPSQAPANKLSEKERQQVLTIANSASFRDLSPKQIVPKLADQGIYLASESTFYRILKEHKMLTHRQAAKPAVARRPKAHLATGPCQVWSWDITYRAPRLGISRGAYSWNARNQMPCSLLWKSMSPSGGDLLLTGRVT